MAMGIFNLGQKDDNKGGVEMPVTLMMMLWMMLSTVSHVTLFHKAFWNDVRANQCKTEQRSSQKQGQTNSCPSDKMAWKEIKEWNVMGGIRDGLTQLDVSL